MRAGRRARGGRAVVYALHELQEALRQREAQAARKVGVQLHGRVAPAPLRHQAARGPLRRAHEAARAVALDRVQQVRQPHPLNGGRSAGREAGRGGGRGL